MTYYALIAACEKAGEHARLLAWFHAMLRAKVEPDLVRYGMALQACERLGKWETGRALVLNMRDRGLAVEPAHGKRLFLLLGREGRGQEALDLLREMEDEAAEEGRAGRQGAPAARHLLRGGRHGAGPRGGRGPGGGRAGGL